MGAALLSKVPGGPGHQMLNSHLLAVHGQELKVPIHRVEGAADTSYALSPGVLTSSGKSHATGRTLRFPEGTICPEHILSGLSALLTGSTPGPRHRTVTEGWRPIT